MSAKKLAKQERARVFRNLQRRVRAAEKKLGIEIKLPSNIGKWTNKAINELNRKQLVYNFGQVMIETGNGKKVKAPFALVERLKRGIEDANKLSKEWTGKDKYKGFEEITASSVRGLEKYIKGVERRGRVKFWIEGARLMRKNFIRSLSRIESDRPQAWQLIMNKLNSMSLKEFSLIMSDAVDINKNLAAYYFDSWNHFSIDVDIAKIFQLLGIQGEVVSDDVKV